MLRTLATVLLALTPAPTPSALQWTPCPGDKIGMECADLTVPADWHKPDGRTITLKVGRLKATGRSEGSVLIAYGGPGGPGIALTQRTAESWAGLRRRMDLLTWDTRGYGEQFQGLSTGLSCVWTRIPLSPVPRDDAEFGRLAATNRSYAETCRNKDPELFANMSSADHARDMEAIRRATGGAKLNYYGASYAGFYGQAYARLFPGNVRTMALDGTWNHSAADWSTEQDAMARTNEQFAARYFTWKGSGSARRWQSLVAAANRTPIPAKSSPGVAYNGRDLQNLFLGLTRGGPAAWGKLAKAIDDARRGDASGFVPEQGGRYPDQLTGVTECTDWPRATTRASLTTEVNRLRKLAPSTGEAGTLAAGTLACIGWPAGVTNPPTPLPKGLPPLLGTGAWGESDAVQRVVNQVPGSAVVRHEGPGHTLYAFNPCARTHIDRYLTDTRLPPAPDTKC
ncbi:alpha/beta fold hydrolase [Nonomuraea typhae]|uniref:alpha/beta fold hydrolase n=1 Tax=Nonomuraea typhae TaxID=2603600 RepID=UPI0012FCA8B2|nr:alpha/beta fold hydrolase [Nonomuraea typhae]